MRSAIGLATFRRRTTMNVAEDFLTGLRRWRGGCPALALLVSASSGCGAECPLNSVPALSVRLESVEGRVVAAASISYEFAGDEHGPLSCYNGGARDDGAPFFECAALDLYVLEAGANGALVLDVISPGFKPSSTTHQIKSDGCSPMTEDVTVVLEWLPLEQICDAYCSTVFSCEDDLPWPDTPTCIADCVDDVADPPPDVCVPLYRELYACVGGLSCGEYAAYQEKEVGHACASALDAIDACEVALGD